VKKNLHPHEEDEERRWRDEELVLIRLYEPLLQVGREGWRERGGIEGLEVDYWEEGGVVSLI
jgi:hypothetical protein